MLRSIRWRLVMGTMLLTLLTVSTVGVVALLLMQRYLVEQERAYLSANAEAIAKQAAEYMTPVQFAPPLQQLAHTAAFLSDVNVRIVDDTQMPLADSGAILSDTATLAIEASPIYFRVGVPSPQEVPNEMMWTRSTQSIEVPAIAAEAQPAKQVVEPLPYVYEVQEPLGLLPAEPASPEAVSPGQVANVIIVQKSPSIWGDRLTFAGETLPMSGTLTETSFTNVAYAGATMVDMEGVSNPEALPGVAAMPVAFTVDQQDMTFSQAIGLQVLDMVTAPIQSNGTVVGWVELGRSTDLVNEPLGAIRRALGIAAGASALMAIGVGLVMGRTLTTPIRNLAQAAAAMSSGDLTARAPVMGRDELGALAHQFNQMADALHRSFAELAAERDTLRRFVADASHELRTPITALRTFNELLQGPAREDQEAQAEFLAESQAQIARLEWITRNLLDLSRWDGGMATLVMREAELGDLVATAAAPFRTLAQERQIDLNVVIPETPLVATVDEQRLGMALGNLLDNALKFTPCAGSVEVGACQDEQGMKIWVHDTGMGICTEELPHIFERFYRSPRATQAGSGLGLAIVERIVKAHGATIQVESEEGAGSCFMLYFA